jgi:alkylation response protein AidB-like acyl-CoA dehydrogenase
MIVIHFRILCREGTRNSMYSFREFLEKRDSYDDYADNPFLQKVVKHFFKDDWKEMHDSLSSFSKKTSFRYRKLSEQIARIEVRPHVQHFNAYNERIDRIIRPNEMLILEKEVFQERLFSSKTSPKEQMFKRYLLHQNGESGIMCPLACTDGLVALLEHFQDELNRELQQILLHCKEGIDGDFGIGAQYMSEIQGGSNIPANVLKAVPDGKVYRLYGNKFFCSAVHADYAVVTARVEGTNQIGVFIVPSWLPGDKEREKRNGFVINRLKWKLGTCELPTAEIDYDGAIAYPIGPLHRGVAIAVSIVLTRSRLDIGLASGAFLMRAARETKLYAKFREVFGRKIDEFPLAKGQLEAMEEAAKRVTVTAFKIHDLFHQLNRDSDRSSQLEVRELILLQKICASKEAVESLRKAISIFGGHGVMEDFSSIPRLFRDAIVNELWEGPRNVLLAQIYRDLKKAEEWYRPEDFVRNLLSNTEDGIVKELVQMLKRCLSVPIFGEVTEETVANAKEWELFCEQLFYEYQRMVLKEVGNEPIVSNENVTV